MHYFHNIIPGINIPISTVIVLLFTGLAIVGIGESALVLQ
jgi:hypothetical protein